MKPLHGLTLLVVGTVLTGCAGQAALTLDTATTAGRSVGLVADGPIQGEVVDGHACFWVTNPDGATFSLVWPEGAAAKPDPLRVEDRDGLTIATVGDEPSGLAGAPAEEPGCHMDTPRFVIEGSD